MSQAVVFSNRGECPEPQSHAEECLGAGGGGGLWEELFINKNKLRWCSIPTGTIELILVGEWR